MVTSIFRRKRKRVYRSILITGASSGIGKALAKQAIAYDNVEKILLVGRTPEKLAQVARELVATVDAAAAPEIVTYICDFADFEQADAFRTYILEQDARSPIDLVIANAGMTSSSDGEGATVTLPAFYNAMVDVNIKGVLDTVFPLLNRMRSRHNGHVVVTSSINAYLGASNQFLYNSTKSFLRTFGMDLAQHVKQDGILVTTVAPGLVETGLTKTFWQGNQSTFPRFLAQDPDKFARVVWKGILRGDGFISYPYYQFFLTFLSGTLPPTLRQTVSKLYTKLGIAGRRVT